MAKKTDKEKKIEAEAKKLREVFENMPEGKRIVSENLVMQAAFMAIELDGLQEQIKENGTVEEYTNRGEKVCSKTNAYMATYNSLIKNYSSVIKLLLSQLEGNDKAAAGSKLAAFMRK